MDREESICLCSTPARRHVAILTGPFKRVKGPLRAYEYLESEENGKVTKCSFLVDVHGFYRCNSCKGMIRAVCYVCDNNHQYANKYNFLAQRVICTECINIARGMNDVIPRIWGRPDTFFTIPPPSNRNVTTRTGKAITKRYVVNPKPWVYDIVEYCGMSIRIPRYENSVPHRCVYCCGTFTDATMDTDVLVPHNLERSICCRCAIDFFTMERGAFTLIPKSIVMDGDVDGIL